VPMSLPGSCGSGSLRRVGLERLWRCGQCTVKTYPCGQKECPRSKGKECDKPKLFNCSSEVSLSSCLPFLLSRGIWALSSQRHCQALKTPDMVKSEPLLHRQGTWTHLENEGIYSKSPLQPNTKWGGLPSPTSYVTPQSLFSHLTLPAFFLS